jgi:hypothetical protein
MSVSSVVKESPFARPMRKIAAALERVLSLREAHRKFPTMKSQVSGCLKYCVWAILSTFGALPKYLTAPSSSGLPSIADVPSVGTIKSLKLLHVRPGAVPCVAEEA